LYLSLTLSLMTRLVGCRECFDAIDTEHKGHISKQKLKEFVKSVPT
jgi:Ca2+-binding EF-hand superfamily protein